MSVATQLKEVTESGSETRSVLGPGGNRVRVSKPEKAKKVVAVAKKKSPEMNKVLSRLPDSAARSNGSINSCCSSDSYSSSSSSVKVKSVRSRVRVRENGVKVVPDGGVKSPEVERPVILKRCDWITPNSDPLYASFHDEEWGVPVHDDNKLFEVLVFSEALAELSWPAILNQRDLFRKLFDNFDIASVAQFTEKKILTLKAHGNFLLSEPKLRAIVENAKQMLKVQQEFGSFNNYCWSFVNHKPVQNGRRYSRQVPVKTPKAEVISKDLIRRGFRSVGPAVVYSFMQVAGIVNDHIITCFRYKECASNVNRNTEGKTSEAELVKALESTSITPV